MAAVQQNSSDVERKRTKKNHHLHHVDEGAIETRAIDTHTHAGAGAVFVTITKKKMENE